jgi:predicted ATPase/class 3 adenylate cyclase
MPVFMFTDIEGSTKKWEKYPDQMKSYISKHDTILTSSVKKHGGEIIKHTGDGVFAIFVDGDPLQASIDVQLGLAREDWGDIGEMRVRIGLHAGHADKHGDDYFGPVVNRTARVMGTAWGGQIIITPEVKGCAQVPKGAILKDMGMHMLKDLGEPQQLLQLLHPDMQLKEFPPLHSLSAHPHNLPIQTTPFLGRKEEVAEITRLLADAKCRLITLIGPGGIGKTRLALQCAAEKIECFTHGVFFIPLDPLSSAEGFITTIAQTLKFQFYSREDEKQQLFNFLADKELLFVMDNFEHIVEGASIIGDILKQTRNVKIMVTSRELLNLKGEWIVQLQGMEVPSGEGIDIEGCSAVQLFLYNAQRVKTQVALSEEDKVYVTRICQLVGGLPLGIEIASSWVRTLTCKEIALEIEKNYDFLVTSMRDIPERHRSLRAVFEYSWNLISEKEKNVLKRLSVFRGGFTREAAELLTGATLSDLASLTDKSLLFRDISGRYRMFGILRQYAEEKLSEEGTVVEDIEDAHAEFYADFMHEREEDIHSARCKEVYDEIKTEIENVRKAFERAIERGKAEWLNKFAVTSYFVYNHYGWYSEAEKLYERSIKAISEKETEMEQITYGRLLSRYAIFRYSTGHYEEARRDLLECLEIFNLHNDVRERAQAMMSLGNIDSVLGNLDAATKYYEQVLKIFRQINDVKNIAGILNNLGVIYYYKHDYDKAKMLYQESSEISKKINYREMTAMAMGNLGLVHHQEEDYKEAKRLLLACLEIERTYGDQQQIANTLNNLGLALFRLKEYAEAKRVYQDSLEIRLATGHRLGLSTAIHNLGNLALEQGEFKVANKYFTEDLQICRDLQHNKGIAQALCRLGESHYMVKEFTAALECFIESVQIILKHGYNDILDTACAGIARSYNELNEFEKAYEICLYIDPDELHEDKEKEGIRTIMKYATKKIPKKTIDVLKNRTTKKKLRDIAVKYSKDK